MLPPMDDRPSNSALDRWVDHGPGVTWVDIGWTAGAFALLAVLFVFNFLHH